MVTVTRSRVVLSYLVKFVKQYDVEAYTKTKSTMKNMKTMKTIEK